MFHKKIKCQIYNLSIPQKLKSAKCNQRKAAMIMNGTEISDSKNRKEQKRKSVKCWFFKTISKIGKCLRRLMTIKRSWPFPKSGIKWDISTYLTAVKKKKKWGNTSNKSKIEMKWNTSLKRTSYPIYPIWKDTLNSSIFIN